MHPKISRLALIVGTGALVSSGGVAAYAQSTTSSSSATKAARHAGARPAKLTDAQLTTVAEKLGVSLDALKAAMTSARPAKPAADKGAGFAADLASALGVDTAKVQTILDANRPAKPAAGAKPTSKPDDTKLVAALASGLNLDTATVQAALDKVHAAHPRGPKGDRGAAMDAAIAKALGKTAAEVHAAFATVRPAKPAAA